ncbi:MAG: amino acid adenylation domain-containing protein, partial [bacterium]|nr:amino acid adenylation domain-containing protein [bacterium]
VVLPGERMQLDFSFNGNVYDTQLVSRIGSSFKYLTRQIVDNEDGHIDDFELISPEEKTQLLADFATAGDDAGYPDTKNIHQLFEEQVEKLPEHTAVVYPANREDRTERTSLSYGELNRKADHLANRLRENGVGPDCIAALAVNRSPGMIAGIMGILKAGGAYLPIDPDYPEERIRFMLKDSRAKVLVSGVSKVSRLCEESLTCRVIDIAQLDEDDASPLLPIRHAQPSSLAYVIYTSGTTGKPKGVLIEHRNVVRLMINDAFQFSFTQKDVWSMFHSFCFDFSVWEIYGALLYGGRLIVVPGMVARDTSEFLKRLKEEKVTVLNQTPSAFYNLIDLDLNDTLNASPLDCIRYVIFGGEALRPAKLDFWKEKYPQTQLINMYGITETTVHVTYKEIGAGEIALNTSNVGRAIPTLSTYILDKNLNLVPPGVAGELCVGGEGLGRGYLNRPALTREKFTDNPFIPGKTLYRSGDLARRLPDGDIEYLGRIDQQVKIRGFRIELGEIENVLLGYDKIKEAIVLAREGEGGDKYLCAYIVPVSSGTAAGGGIEELDVSRIREFLSNHLPAYMVPSFFVQLEQVPLTSSGKLDRKALPEAAMQVEKEYEAPRNEVEEVLTKVWAEVLGLRRVGINDNFFEIGGDSIKSIQIAARINKAGYKVEIKDIFGNPLISNLSHKVKKAQRIADQAPVSGEVPLTPIQKRFFRFEFPGSHHFNQAVMLYSREGIDEEAVKTVFTRIMAHHDALRMTCRTQNGKHIQINRSLDLPLSLKVYNLEKEPEAVKKMESLADEIQTGIDLKNGPLVKLGLFHLENGDRLLIVIHHLVIDGVSWRILFEDIETLYQQYREKQALKLPLKSDSFKLWSGKLCRYADREAFLKEKDYWKELESTTVPRISGDFDSDGKAVKEDSGSSSFRLGKDETQQLLKQVNEAFGTEINDI